MSERVESKSSPAHKPPTRSPASHTPASPSQTPTPSSPSFAHDFSRVPASGPVGGVPTGAMRGGFRPGVEPGEAEEFLGGRTFGEVIGDIARPVGTAVGNVVGGIAEAVTGITISSTTNTGPTWRPHGEFEWIVGFTTSGQNGWLVQEVVNTYRAQDAAKADLGGPAPTGQYWEAWAVDGASAITPGHGANHDWWLRPGRGADTQGHWSMQAKVYFTTTDPATQGFTPGGAPDAGILLSSTAAPAGLGVARLHRYAQGTWDSTGGKTAHTGSAT